MSAAGWNRPVAGTGARAKLPTGASHPPRPPRRPPLLARFRAQPPDADRRTTHAIRNPEHVFRSRTKLPIPIDQVFAFFSAAENLERITPPELRFAIESPCPIELRRGSRIDYRLSLFGVPFRWRTEITVWLPPFEFVDTQLGGPYAQWIHRHRFQAVDGGTEMEDEVRYRLPVPILGELARPLVKLQIGRIFRYRKDRIRELLGAHRPPPLE